MHLVAALRARGRDPELAPAEILMSSARTIRRVSDWIRSSTGAGSSGARSDTWPGFTFLRW